MHRLAQYKLPRGRGRERRRGALPVDPLYGVVDIAHVQWRVDLVPGLSWTSSSMREETTTSPIRYLWLNNDIYRGI